MSMHFQQVWKGSMSISSLRRLQQRSPFILSDRHFLEPFHCLFCLSYNRNFSYNTYGNYNSYNKEFLSFLSESEESKRGLLKSNKGVVWLIKKIKCVQKSCCFTTSKHLLAASVIDHCLTPKKPNHTNSLRECNGLSIFKMALFLVKMHFQVRFLWG